MSQTRSQRVLLLNKNEMLVSVVDWQTAVCLLVKGCAASPYGYDDHYRIPVSVQSAVRMKAEGKFKTLIEQDEAGIERGYFLLPSALILVQYVNIPYRRAAVNKKNVLKRDHYLCGYCSAELTDKTGTVDHIVPHSRWKEFVKLGRVKGAYANNWQNVVACCRHCNCRKDNRLPDEAGMTLRIKPFVPSRDYLILRGIDLQTCNMWERWVKLSDTFA